MCFFFRNGLKEHPIRVVCILKYYSKHMSRVDVTGRINKRGGGNKNVRVGIFQKNNKRGGGGGGASIRDPRVYIEASVCYKLSSVATQPPLNVQYLCEIL